MNRRVAIIAGCRTPFVKMSKSFAAIGPLRLACHAVEGLLERSGVGADLMQAIAYGAVIPEPGRPNLAREIVFETGLPKSIEAQTISSYCITGLRAITAIADAIATQRIEVGIAGGVDSFSHADPEILKEPSTGLTMGQHTELTRKEWDIPRERQDEIALKSHENAVAARAELAAEIHPLASVTQDSGPREGTSIEALSGLKPVFGPEGTITAGNASPLTDGASAVLLMSEERAEQEGKQPLAFLRAMEYGAVDIADGLLMAPALVVPRMLERCGVRLADCEIIEIHEAFAAQVLANAKAWEQGWKGPALDPIDWSRVNVSGSSIALGHPWSATGGRIVATLANEMVRRDARLGLVSICAAGAMAGAMLLERE